MHLWQRVVALAVAGVLFVLTQVPGWAQSDIPEPDPVPVTVTLTTDKIYYRPGEPVILTMTVRNIGSQPVTLLFNASQRYDFLIRHVPTGQVVWQWSLGKQFLWVLGTETLQPGEVRVVKEEWKQLSNANALVPTGFYRLDSVVTSSTPAALPSNPGFIQIGRRLF